MSDVRLTCADCGQSFDVTYEQQRRNRERKLPKQFCPACRERRRHARDAGMKSEVGQPASFAANQKPQRNRPPKQAQPVSTDRPVLPPARTPQAPNRPAAAPRQRPAPADKWRGLDLLKIAVFAWLMMTLIVLQRFGVLAAAVVGGVGIAIAIWHSSKR